MERTEDVCWGYRAGSLTAVAVLHDQEHLRPTSRRWSVVCDCGRVESRGARDLKAARRRGMQAACRSCLRALRSRVSSGRRKLGWR